MRIIAILLAALMLPGCASMFAPSAARLASLPVVTFPEKPPAGDFIFKLPAGRPIPLKVILTGSLLADSTVETLTTQLAKDLYIHKYWVSEDGKTWQPAGKLVDVRLSLSLPSDAHPKPAEIILSVSRKKD